jgi:cell division protease FtsH
VLENSGRDLGSLEVDPPVIAAMLEQGANALAFRRHHGAAAMTEKDKGVEKNATGFARLASAASAAPEDYERETDFDLQSDEADGNDAPGDEVATFGNPSEVLVAGAMTAATTPAVEDALRRRSAQAVVVSAPSADWIAPLKRFFESRAFGRKWTCVARDGSDRRYHKPSAGNAEVASDLASGRSVVGIAVSPEQVLPSTLIAAADVQLAVKLEPKIVEDAIRKLYGEIPPRIDKRDLVGLDIDDVVAAMRPCSSEQDVTTRLSAAARARAGQAGADDVPDLETAVEYGAAREWGLALARDMRDYRAGALPWSAVDRGAIFYSGPGMGKSVLARSLARACEANLVVGSVGELFATSSGHLDGVIRAMRELFAKAVAAAPSILFIDEIDGLPSRESLDDSRGRDFWMPIIEDFMLLLDDATSGKREGVVVIGATNRIDAVDPAILRPGRLERAIEVTAPGPDGILNILRFHVRGSLSDDELRSVLDPLEGCTPAEIMEKVRTARRKARHGRRDLSIEDLRNAALPEPDLAPAALYRIAVHEAGHVVSAESCDPGEVTSVRIVGRNGAGGFTRFDMGPVELVTKRWIERRVVSLLSGRAAEIVLLGDASSGAGGRERSDLALATRLLAAMTLSFGLDDDQLIYVADYDEVHRELRDPHTRRRVDEAMRRLQARALEIVERHRAQVEAIAQALIRRRFLSGEEIKEILARTPATAGNGPDVDMGTRL